MVIDMRTRQPYRICQHDPEPDDEQRVKTFIETCLDRIWMDSLKVKAITTKDNAVAALRRLAEEMQRGPE